jgi:large-conductance mechanosensitive channel
MKESMKLLIFAIIGGAVITLITGLINTTPEMLVGAVYYGYPFAWLEMLVIAPQYFPWHVRPLRLVLDIVIWAVIIWVILFAISKARKK